MRRIAPKRTSRARGLREDSTEAEVILWGLLRGRQLLGYKFRRQFSVGMYFVDFVCLDRKLIVELDGGQHQEQADYDSERTRWLASRGFRVFRFWNSDVLGNLEGVLSAIAVALEEAS